MAKKERVWTKAEIKDAFFDYLEETNQWEELSIDDLKCLMSKHFGIFFRELKRWQPKRKIKINAENY